MWTESFLGDISLMQSPSLCVYLVLSSFLPQVPGHVKFSTDTTKPDLESWLMYIQFASLAQQHNLTLCQVDDQVCGDTFTDSNINIEGNLQCGGSLFMT